MIIIETHVFTRQMRVQMSDDEYRALQTTLGNHPNAGVLIKGGGGLRKFRWNAEGRGKRSGVRIIYYWAPENDRLLMLFMYLKGAQSDLTPRQLAILKEIIDSEFP